MNVAVTEPEYRKAEAVFVRAVEEGLHCIPVPAEEEALASVLRQNSVDHAVVGVSPYRGPLYESLPRGGVIARFGVGHDGIDKGLATQHGLLCTNTPGVLDDSVAEHAMGLLLALVRQIPSLATRLAGGEWAPRLGTELAGKRLAVLGCGGIGRRVARIAACGFGMKVVGLRRTLTAADDLREQFGFARIVSEFAEAVGSADVVSVHLPGGTETHHFLNEARLRQLPHGCLLINTARGSVLDENALFNALFEGRLGGAALDVFEKEPYQPQEMDKDLRRLPNIVLTPHTGSSTREACERMARRALRNIQLAASANYGEMDLLNPAILKSFASACVPRAAE